jgi:hypothetical protein
VIDIVIRSVIDVNMTPRKISVVATKMGLSPLFHLAFFKIGIAGSFSDRLFVLYPFVTNQ